MGLELDDCEYVDLAPGLLRHHDTECPAYNTKGRDVFDAPCLCGARPTTAHDAAVARAAKLELLSEVFALVAERIGHSGTAQGHVYSAALLDLQDKYGAAKEKTDGG